jgi:hypothetical protein
MHEFDAGIKPYDGLPDSLNSLGKCFEWDGEMLRIFTQQVYKYCTNFYKLKLNDKHVGRSIQFYLGAKGYEYTKNQSRSGRYFSVKICNHENKNGIMKHHEKHERHHESGWKPIESDEDLF